MTRLHLVGKDREWLFFFSFLSREEGGGGEEKKGKKKRMELLLHTLSTLRSGVGWRLSQLNEGKHSIACRLFFALVYILSF